MEKDSRRKEYLFEHKLSYFGQKTNGVYCLRKIEIYHIENQGGQI